MPKAYWVNTFRSVTDEAKLAAYVALSGDAIRAAGGRFVARGTAAYAFELGAKQRTVVIEFESAEAAAQAYQSPAYQEALRALDGGAERDIRIVEAVE